MSLKLYGYWRSSASYRVRIALNLKNLAYEYMPVHLVKDGGQQHAEQYVSLNPSELVPTFVDEDEDIILNQSLSIIEYLDEKYPDVHPLLPPHKVEKARVRALAYDTACDIQPIANLRVLNYLSEHYNVDGEGKKAWCQTWITKGFRGIEKRLQNTAGDYCFGFNVTLADIALVPQVYNAERFGVDMSAFPLIRRINDNCNELDAFKSALPEAQIDAS
ncbi:maleylacetoacetate isomerase [Aestuariibacter sp. AA17]|uniref:Maleylacetoacetate isomerase n=1 Tax=Fluctibacter corallii TaxID=2984329 RepID=A0ABT3A389_9ALTE|nr:maleylacetoacetate isomerase [Aestuariibacter sp. AA17]MCV2883146.1 maleylacetoacetate isomerase [Aestuariibacter sp. AA17]